MSDIETTLTDRGKVHGSWSERCETSQLLKSILFAHDPGYTASESEALEMICVKLSRIKHGDPHNPDHWLDISGYSALALRELKA